MKAITRSALMTAGLLAAAMGAGVAASQAGSFGNAQWCAVQDLGAGDVVWDCEYRTVEACAPQIVAGNRGFCNLNPSWVPPAAAAPARHRKRHS